MPSRGRVLLIHGPSSIAGTWWRIGPALAARGWDVSAVDRAGQRLPVELDGGHCLHRDAPAEWLAAVAAMLG